MHCGVVQRGDCAEACTTARLALSARKAISHGQLGNLHKLFRPKLGNCPTTTRASRSSLEPASHNLHLPAPPQPRPAPGRQVLIIRAKQRGQYCTPMRGQSSTLIDNGSGWTHYRRRRNMDMRNCRIPPFQIRQRLLGCLANLEPAILRHSPSPLAQALA